MTMNPPTKSGAANHRGRSKQDYETPKEFMDAVERRFGKIDFDLAASDGNAKAAGYFTEADDSLKADWRKLPGLLWLNPPFGDIAPWAKKCAAFALGPGVAATLHFLVPASVDSNWWGAYVHDVATTVYFCNPRLSFDGKNPFPKPVALCRYTPPQGKHYTINHPTIYAPWRWKV